MAACLLTRKPEVKEQLDKYTNILGSYPAAYYVLSQNNGYDLNLTPDGQPSKLFSDLLEHFHGDEAAAIREKSKIFSDQFKTQNTVQQQSTFALKGGDIVYGHPAIGKTYSVEHGSHAGEFIDWDVEYNEKRDKWIEDKTNTKKGTPEYKKARNEYLIYPEKHPDYVEFLTKEWNRVKAKAKRENKILVASPHNLLKLFTEDFNYIIDLESSDFINRNIQRGGDERNSKLWKEGIDNTINNVQGIPRIILHKGEYFEDFLNVQRNVDNLEQSEPSAETVLNFGKVYHQTVENKTFIPRSFLTDRQFKQLAKNLARLFPEISVLWHQNLPEDEYGRIDTTDLEAIVIMLSDDYQADTLPHEYAHRYIEMFRNIPIVQKAIKQFGSEEALVQAIGEQATRQIGEAWGFWKKLWEYIKAVFSKQSTLKRAMQIDLTNAFLQRKDLAKKSNIISNVIQQGAIYFQKTSNKITDLGKARQAIQSIVNQVQFDEGPHKYTHNGVELKSVSEWKQDLLYGVYDDSDLSENQKDYNDKSRIIGTTIHAALESMFNGTYRRERFSRPMYSTTTGKLKQAALSPAALKSLETIYKNITSKYDLVAAEAILADFDAKVAGTADLVLRNKKTGEFGVYDYKTKCIELDGKRENKDGKRLWGFSYVNKSKSGARTATNAYDFQLTAYQYMLNKLGISTSERGIIPIVYKYNSKTDTVEEVFFSKKMGTYEINPEEGVYHVAQQESVKYDVHTRVFGEESDKYDDEYIKNRTTAFKQILDSIIKSLSNKAMIDRMAGRRSQSRQLQYTIDQIGNVSEVQAMLSYLRAATDQLTRVYERISQRYAKEGLKSNKEPVSWDFASLREYKELALAFNMVHDIDGFMQQYRSFFTNEELDNISQGVSEVLSLQSRILSAYKNVGMRLYMAAMSPYVKNIEANYRLQFEREYRSSHQKVDKNEMQRYIDNKIESIRPQIEEETQTWLRRQMDVADNLFECSTIAANIGNLFQSSDPFVQAAAKHFDEVMQNVDHEYIKWERQLLKLTDEYEKKYGVGNWSNHRQAYDDIVEIVDGQAYLVSSIPNAFKVAYVKMLNEVNEDNTLTFQQKQDKITEWFDQNAPIQDIQGLTNDFVAELQEQLSELPKKAFDEIIKNAKADRKDKKSWYVYYKQKKITLAQLDTINGIYNELLEKYRVIDSTKYPNKKYQNLLKLQKSNDVKYRLWEFLQDAIKKGDKNVSLRQRLDNRLPSIRKTNVERVAEEKIKGVKDAVVNTVKESAMLVEDDSMLGQTFTDMNGNVIKQIPLFYNRRLDVADQSFDLPTIFARWYRSAKEHQAKVQMEDYMLMTAEILKNRSVEAQQVSILSRLRGKEERAVTKGENTYKMFASWLDQVFYGNSVITTSQTFGRISIDKLAQTLMRYYSLRVMGTNYVAMINNASVGTLNQLIEAVGGEVIDFKSYGKAVAFYGRHLATGQMLADMGRRAPKDFVNQLIEWFGILESSEPNFRAKGVQRLFTTDAAYWTNNVGEHMNQGVFLLAALYKLQAVDKDGNKLGDMINYLSFDNNGVLVVDPKVANFDATRQSEFSMGIRSTLMSIHGNYADRWKVALQQYLWGKMILMFRKWVYTGFKRRFGKRYYDNIRGIWAEGYHTTTLRLGAGILLNPAYNTIVSALGKQLETNKKQVLRWNELTDQEKSNLYRSVTELGIIITCYALAQVFKGLADDNDDDDSVNIYMNISYQFYRAYNDLSFNINPSAMVRIIQSPFPLMSSIDDLTKLFERAFTPTEIYTTGPHAGENKLWYSIKDFIPIVRQQGRFENIQEEFEFLKSKG